MAKVDYFSEESLRHGLKKKVVRGGIVVASSRVISLTFSLITVPILARLISPEDFGLIETVAVFTNFAAMFVDAGLSKATVQRDSITHQQVSNLFWIASGFGTTIALTIAALSPFVAWAFEEPRLQPVMLAMSLSYALSGFTIQHQALLQRSMNYLSLSTAGIISTACGQIAAIIYAYQFQGTNRVYWALVLMPLVSALVRMVLTWFFCAWIPSFPKRDAGTRDLLVFGANLTSFNFVNYFARNTDKMLISWWWGLTSVGYYGRAYRLLLVPLTQLAPPVDSLVVPMLSRLKNEPEKYRKAFLTVVRPYLWLTIAIVGCLYLVSDPLVLIYFGPGWEEVTPVFRALIPAGWSCAITCCSSWVFSSWGHVDRQLKWGLLNSSFIIIVTLISVPYGIIAASYSIGIAYSLLRIPGFIICFKGTPIQLRDIAIPCLIPTLVSTAVVCISGLIHALWFVDQSNMQELVSMSIIYFLLIGVAFLSFPKNIQSVMAFRNR